MITKNEQIDKQLIKEGFEELTAECIDRRFKDVKLKDVGYTQRYYIDGEEFKKIDNTISEWVANGSFTYYGPETPVQILVKTEEPA